MFDPSLPLCLINGLLGSVISRQRHRNIKISAPAPAILPPAVNLPLPNCIYATPALNPRSPAQGPCVGVLAFDHQWGWIVPITDITRNIRYLCQRCLLSKVVCKGQKVGVWRESAMLVIVWDRESYADDLVGPASNDRIGGWEGRCCGRVVCPTTYTPAAWGAVVAPFTPVPLFLYSYSCLLLWLFCYIVTPLKCDHLSCVGGAALALSLSLLFPYFPASLSRLADLEHPKSICVHETMNRKNWVHLVENVHWTLKSWIT